jgi:hypothetical protein
MLKQLQPFVFRQKNKTKQNKNKKRTKKQAKEKTS